MQPSDCAHLQPLCSEVSLGLKLDHELARTLSRAWVISDSGNLCGFCLTWIVFDEAEIAAMGIVRSARGRGLGRRLLEHTVSGLRQLDVIRATLEVACTNAAAVGLYQSAGFRRFNVRTGYYRGPVGSEPVDAWEMELLLPPKSDKGS